tara:strand:+ start:415 stop:1227 length:813 start_codon:yes stop_codon:yes gene_type:complete
MHQEAETLAPEALRWEPVAAPPQLHGGVSEKLVVAAKQVVPRAKNPFLCLSAELVAHVREFVAHRVGALYALFPLMLASKDLYRCWSVNKLLLRAIAKDVFGFYYLSCFQERIYTFRGIVMLCENISGSELYANPFEFTQLLRNGRMSSKEVYAYTMDFKVCRTEGLEIFGLARQNNLLRLRQLMKQFEQTHNGIALGVFRPHSNCYPMRCFNGKVRLVVPQHSLAALDHFAYMVGDKDAVARLQVAIQFKVQGLKYNFRLQFLRALRWP